MRLSISLLVLITLCFSSAVFSQATLIEDLYVGNSGSDPSFAIEYDNEIYFAAENGTFGRELWKTDGNTISLVQDLSVGAQSSTPERLFIFGSELVYTATNGATGQEFWTFDGTTHTLHDVNPGASSSVPLDFTVFNGELYFSAYHDTFGRELWKYDGTSVSLVIDYIPGVGSGDPQRLITLGSELVLSMNHPTAGQELHRYDGSTISLITDLRSGSVGSFPGMPTEYNGNLYFTANDGVVGSELFTYNGSAVSLVSDIEAGANNSSPFSFTVVGSSLYFRAFTSANGSELYEYDGTTVTLHEINPGTSGSDPASLVEYQGELYLAATTGTFGREIYKYDGTSVSLVQDINPAGSSAPQNLTVIGSNLYFGANDGVSSSEPWRYDGTSAALIQDINPSGASSPDEFIGLGSLLLFTATDGSIGEEWWKLCNPATSTISPASCGSYTVPSGNETYTMSGTYFDTLTSAGGCDSIITINLTINNPTTGVDTQTACGSFTWIDGNTYTSSNNTATDTLTNVAGCDSIVTLNLTINNSTTGVDTQIACDSFTWIDGNTYTSSNNTATDTLTNAAGCDSVVTLNLTINNSTTGVDTLVACDSFTWIDGNNYTSSNTTATHTLTNAAGCDSIVTLNLTINNSTTGIDTQVACDSFTWIDGNNYTSSNTTATHTLTNAAGCDSVVTLNLTINISTTAIDTQVACDSFTWIDGNNYTSSNTTATHTLTNAAGCDSIVTLNLTINNSTTGTDTQVACDSFTWIDGNNYTSSNNTATHILTNAAGCDSIVTLNLTINNSTTGTDTQVACDSFTWIDGNNYTSSNNTATHTLTNAAGCDSVVTLNLTINSSTTGIDTQVACDSFTWIDGNNYTSTNNTATHTLINAAGCDSTVTLNLTINNSTTGVDTQVACDSFTWIDGNNYTSSNTTATHTLTNAAGCDSVVTLNLTINNSTTGIDTQVACDSFTWIDGNSYTSSNNTATHILTNAAGCDSVVTLNLTINSSTTGIDTQVACDSFTWIDGNNYTSSNTTATHTLTNAAGCDSIVTLNLTINSSTTGVDTQVASDSFTWIDGNNYTSSNNTATHILTNAAGCDSIVTLNLTINTVDVSVSNASPTLTANASSATYQWIDCATMLPIAGEINQSFTATANGDYAVIVTENGCTDTSACFTVLGIGIEENSWSSAVVIYPNPVRDNFTVELENPEGERVIFEFRDITGRVIASYQTSKSSIREQFSTRGLSTGMYFLTVSKAGQLSTYKVLKN